MNDHKITDEDIPSAEPEALIKQYNGLVYKVANRYLQLLSKQGYAEYDDLCQAGRIGLLTAKEKYDPSLGKKFQNFAWDFINTEIKRALGFHGESLSNQPVIPLYADQPINDESEDTLLDFIPDETIETADDMIERIDRAEAVHEAVDKLCDSQKEIINLHYFQNKELSEIADIIGIEQRKVSTTQHSAILRLKDDNKLRYRIMNGRDPYYVHVGVGQFNQTWTSSTELGVIICEERENRMKKRLQAQIDSLKRAMAQKNQ